MMTGWTGRCARGAAGWLGLLLWGTVCGVVWAQATPPGPGGPASGPPVSAAPPPAELFYRPDDISQAVLSPSGRWLAMLTTHLGQRAALVVLDLADTRAPTVVARYADADVREFHWVGDERLVYNLIDRQSGGGAQRFGAGLFSVQRDGSDRRLLLQLRGDRLATLTGPGREPLPWNHVLLHVPAQGDEVIVGEGKFDITDELREILPKRLNVVTGRVRSLAEGVPSGVFTWLFDARGEPRVAVARRDGRERLHVRAAPGQPWRQLTEHPVYQAPFQPRFVDADGRLYVVTSSGAAGAAELRGFDLTAGRPEAEPLVRTPGFDFLGRLVAETPGGVTLGVRVETDAETTVWFDPRLKALQQEVDRRLPGRVNRLSCRRCQQPDSVVLVESFSDRDPGQWLLLRPAQDKWRLVGARRSGVDPRQMGQRDFHRIRARDGLDLPVWVTTPPGPRPDAGWPTVVLVHGGPWVRGGHWRWQGDAQFLASRGYLVVEPEFRGSRGYGHAHFQAGVRQWGLAMQDDVADALQWAVKQGQADGRRACIAGGSYGGYATLMGLVRHPELYRCGAAWAAVTDPRLMFEWTPISDQRDEVRRHDYPYLIGDPVADADRLTAVAPVAQAARIKAPVLLAMGALDRRVPLAHGTRMRDALREAGNAPEWVVYDDEGHGWLTLKNRVDFAQRLEAFMARHLK